jgi:RNA polymerase sigma factor (sigma-70 family)
VECYQLHYRRLVRALALAGAPHATAEELAQEAFARTLTHWRRVRSGSSPAGYAYRVGFRLLNRHLPGGAGAPGFSGNGRRADPDRDYSPADNTAQPGPENLVTTRLAVAATLAAMPPRRRACAVMCLVVGLPTSDAATAFGIAEGTVRKHLADARLDLRQGLDQ